MVVRDVNIGISPVSQATHGASMAQRSQSHTEARVIVTLVSGRGWMLIAVYVAHSSIQRQEPATAPADHGASRPVATPYGEPCATGSHGESHGDGSPKGRQPCEPQSHGELTRGASREHSASRPDPHGEPCRGSTAPAVTARLAGHGANRSYNLRAQAQSFPVRWCHHCATGSHARRSTHPICESQVCISHIWDRRIA